MKLINFDYEGREFGLWTIEGNEYLNNQLQKNKTFYEKPSLEYLRSKYSGINTVLDIGAYIGNHSVYFHEVMGIPNVHSFEVNPVALKALKKNAPFAKIYKVAVGDKCRRVGLSGAPVIKGEVHNSCRAVEPGEEFEMVTIDSLDLPGFQLMKVDVEGAELRVFRGAEETLIKYKPVVFAEHWDKHLDEAKNYMKSLGYKVKKYEEPGWEMYEYIHEESSNSWDPSRSY